MAKNMFKLKAETVFVEISMLNSRPKAATFVNFGNDCHPRWPKK